MDKAIEAGFYLRRTFWCRVFTVSIAKTTSIATVVAIRNQLAIPTPFTNIYKRYHNKDDIPMTGHLQFGKAGPPNQFTGMEK
jgi:hypothetical protein